jgi:hypothetical protein
MSGSNPPGGKEPPDERRQGERIAARLTVRFTGPDSLAEAVRSYSANIGLGGLCLAVSRAYQPGDSISLVLETGQGPLPMQAVVAWCRPGYIGVRFTPTRPEHQQTLGFIRGLLGGNARRPESNPGSPLNGKSKPFPE